jgi:chemotaxis protein CheC
VNESNQLEIWSDLVNQSTANAMATLSTMMGREVAVHSLGLRQVSMDEVVRLVGGPEALTVGVYLTVSGNANGHIMLMYEPKIALAFVDMLMGQEIGTTSDLGEMELSALGEMGNVVGSSFLNALADGANLRLMPSPPILFRDMAGALTTSLADVLMTRDEAFIADTTFRIGKSPVRYLFVIPVESLVQALSRVCGRLTIRLR